MSGSAAATRKGLLTILLTAALSLGLTALSDGLGWRWVEPVLDAWQRESSGGGEGPRGYAAGSWGPAAASALVARDGNAWSEEQ